MESQALDYFPRLILNKPVRRYTLEQFLEKEAKSLHKHEFIDGQIIKMPYAKGPHNIIAANMTVAIGIEFEKLSQNHIIFGSDQMVYFPSLDEGVYADALTVCEKPIYWDDNELLLINPIIIVEVLSKSTKHYHRNGKFDKYKTLKSIQEYVLVRQDEHYSEVWYRESPGYWQETIITDLSAKIPLQSVGIKISMEKVYKNVDFSAKK